MEREKIMAQLKRGCSPSPDTHTEDEEDDRPCNNTNTVRPMRIVAHNGMTANQKKGEYPREQMTTESNE